MYRDYKSGNRCIYGNSCLCRRADGEEKPRKKLKKESTQGAAVAILREEVQGCVSQSSGPKKSILWKAGQTTLHASARDTVKFLARTWYEIQIF